MFPGTLIIHSEVPERNDDSMPRLNIVFYNTSIFYILYLLFTFRAYALACVLLKLSYQHIAECLLLPPDLSPAAKIQIIPQWGMDSFKNFPHWGMNLIIFIPHWGIFIHNAIYILTLKSATKPSTGFVRCAFLSIAWTYILPWYIWHGCVPLESCWSPSHRGCLSSDW